MKKPILAALALIFLAVGACSKKEDKPEPQKFYATGLLKPKVKAKGVLHFVPKLNLGAIPDAFGWEEKGLGTPVRNQGQCGSCWAHGSVQMLEMGYKIFGGQNIDFSEQELVSQLFYGCGGGFFATQFLTDHGNTSEAQCGYRADEQPCPAGTTVVGKATSSGHVGTTGRGPTTQEMQTAIMTYGGIAVTMGADGAFMNYRGGLAQNCPSTSTNHIVTLTGWKTVNGQVYFHLKNSWGEGWGEKGYGWFPLGCYSIGEDAAYLIVDAVPCKPPQFKLPASYYSESGDEIVLAVRNLPDTDYTWYQGSTEIGKGNEVFVSPLATTTYRLVAKNRCGQGDVLTEVVIKPSN